MAVECRCDVCGQESDPAQTAHISITVTPRNQFGRGILQVLYKDVCSECGFELGLAIEDTVPASIWWRLTHWD